jgi:hypothetical protein
MFEEGSAATGWMLNVVAQLHAADTGVLVVDHSADAKYSLSGAGLLDWLDTIAPAWPWRGGPQRNLVARRSLKGPDGQLEAIVRSLTRGVDRCLFYASPEHQPRVAEWLRRSTPPIVKVRDDTARYTCLELYGPRRAELIATLSAPGHERTRILVREDRCNGSTLLTLPASAAAGVLHRLQTGDYAVGPAAGGELTEEALRITRGRPRFGHEITPLSPSLTLGAFSSPLPTLGFGRGDPILAGERPIGVITSRLRLPGWTTTLMLGRVDFAGWRGEALEIFAEGHRWPLAARETQWEIDMRTQTYGAAALPLPANL